MADPDWVAAWQELHGVHHLKSATYGTDEDALQNFVDVARVAGLPVCLYPALRMVEKLSRASHMIGRGDSRYVEEFMDVASLALCAEALRRREEGWGR